MQLCIPHLGQKFRLTSDWTFNLHLENRNISLYDLLEIERPDYRTNHREYYGGRTVSIAALPAGTELRIDRIFVRRGLPQFDSVTFFLCDMPNDFIKLRRKAGFKGAVRFWTKLDDANLMEVELCT